MSETPDDILEQEEENVEQEEGGRRAYLSIRRTLPGRRLDSYLQGRFPRYSRTAIKELIKAGAITVNDKPAKPSYMPRAADKINLILPPLETREIIPEPMDLDVIYEDEHLLVLNKQAGIIIHPASGKERGTLVHGLAHYAASLARTDDPFRPGIVHRLDKDTTGVIAVAKTDEAHWRLALQFERRQVEKHYTAVVHGQPHLDGDVIDAPIVAHPRVREKYVARSLPRMHSMEHRLKRLEKSAVTRYEVAGRYGKFAHVNLYPHTGRTHQLRVHMSYIGYPIVGDVLYGGRAVSEVDILGTGDPAPIITRQALHAYRLKVRHPIREEPIEFVAPLPPDMSRLLEVLRRRAESERKS